MATRRGHPSHLGTGESDDIMDGTSRTGRLARVQRSTNGAPHPRDDGDIPIPNILLRFIYINRKIICRKIQRRGGGRRGDTRDESARSHEHSAAGIRSVARLVAERERSLMGEFVGGPSLLTGSKFHQVTLGVAIEHTRPLGLGPPSRLPSH